MIEIAISDFRLVARSICCFEGISDICYLMFDLFLSLVGSLTGYLFCLNESSNDPEIYLGSYGVALIENRKLVYLVSCRRNE